MELKTLSRKQKRLQDWSKVLSSEMGDDDVRLALSDELKLYRNLIAKCWEVGEVSEDDEVAIGSLERKIEQLAEEARLVAR